MIENKGIQGYICSDCNKDCYLTIKEACESCGQMLVWTFFCKGCDDEAQFFVLTGKMLKEERNDEPTS